MGGEFGLIIIYVLGVLLPVSSYLIYLAYRAIHSKKYPFAKKQLSASALTALLFCMFGGYWLSNNFPQDIRWEFFLFVCIIPGLVIGAAIYAVFDKRAR